MFGNKPKNQHELPLDNTSIFCKQEIGTEIFKRPKPKKKMPAKKKKTEQKSTKPKPISPNAAKASKSFDESRYCSRFTTVPLVTSQMHKQLQTQTDTKATVPIITDKEELVLNFETGQWDVVEKNRFDPTQNIPVVLKPEEQTLGDFVSIAEMDEEHAENNVSNKEDIKPTIKSPISTGIVSNPETKEQKRSEHENVCVDQEYVVKNADPHSSSLKLKLTLKKKSSEHSTVPASNPNHTFNRGKGKPSSYVKQSHNVMKKAEPKKSAKKRKMSKVYVLDTSVSDKFFEVSNTLLSYTMQIGCSEVNCETKQENLAFDQFNHLEMVRNFCATRSAHVVMSTNSTVEPLNKNEVEYALTALDCGAVKHLPAEADGHLKGIVTLPTTKNTKTSTEAILLQQEKHPSDSESKYSDQDLSSKFLSNTEVQSNEGKRQSETRRVDEGETIYIATPAPPFKADVVNLMTSLSDEESLDPFYSNPSDIQPTSTRLA